MTQVEYWILYGVLLAIFIVLFNIARGIMRLHADNVIFKLDRDMDRRRAQAREMAEMFMRLGPDSMPDDLIERVFGTVPDIFRKEDGNTSGSERN